MDAYIPIEADGTHHVQVQLIHGDICNDDVDAVGVFRVGQGDDDDHVEDSFKKEQELLDVATGETRSMRSTEGLIRPEILQVKLPNKLMEATKLPNLNFIPGLTSGLTNTSESKQNKEAFYGFPQATETSLKLLTKAGEEVESLYQQKSMSSKNNLVAVRGVVTTNAGNLRQKRIFHLNVTENPDHLQEAVMAALKLADREKIRSLSFPALPMALQHGTNIRNMFETFEQFVKRERPKYLNFIRVVVSETMYELPSYMNAREVHELQLYRDVMVDDQDNAQVDTGTGNMALKKMTSKVSPSPMLPRQRPPNGKLNEDLHEYIEMSEFSQDPHDPRLKLPSDYSEMETVQMGRRSDYDDSQAVSSAVSSSSSSSGASTSSSGSSETSSDDDDDVVSVEETGYKKYSNSTAISEEIDLGLGQVQPRVLPDLQLPSIPVSRLDLDPIQIGAVTTKVTRVHNSGINNQALINFAHPEEDYLGGMEVADGVTKISVGSRTMFNITLSNDPGKFPRLRTMIQATLRAANHEGFRHVSLPGNAVSSQYIQAPYGWRINPAKIYPLLCYQAINDFALYDYQPAILNTIHIVVDDRQTLEVFDQVRKVFENFRVNITQPERNHQPAKDMCCRWYCYWRLWTFGYAFTVQFDHPDSCCCCQQEMKGEDVSMRDRVESLREQDVVSSFLYQDGIAKSSNHESIC